MKSLSEFLFKKVQIHTVDGRDIVGEVVTFEDFFGSGSGEEEIGIAFPKWVEMFGESDIKTVTILQE